MRIRLEKRRELSRVMLALSPIGAVVVTMIGSFKALAALANATTLCLSSPVE